MSLQTLLAQYPNFSARRIRRLATQLQFLEGLGSSEAKGIATDLMALTMQAAKTEAQLSDVAQDSPEKIRNVVVVPSTEAIRAVEDLAQFCNTHSDIRLSSDFEGRIKHARAIVHDSSFVVRDPRPEDVKV